MPSDNKQIALDTSFVVPLLASWHENHANAYAAFEPIPLSRLIVPHHVLMEAFSSLTRMPPPFRLQPEQAWDAIESSLLKVGSLPSTTLEDIAAAVGSCRAAKTFGGRINDAVIAQTALRAGAQELWTWNTRHFLAIAPAGLLIKSPDLNQNRIQ